jgi:predicted DCC family thiol-disulfide oxidoreductase YuxK
MSRRRARGFFRQELVGLRACLTHLQPSVYRSAVTDLPADCECVLLFDGVCHLCDGAVRFVVAHDTAGRIHFAPIQSDLGRRLYSANGLDADAPDTMLLVTRERAFRKSDAVIEIARRLGGAWKLALLGKMIPRSLRDAAYAFVARNRYRWFGKHETCLMPTPELRRRMLS